MQSLEALTLTLLESAFPFCSLLTFTSFSKHGDNTCSLLSPGPRPGWPGHPFLSIQVYQLHQTCTSTFFPPAWDAACLDAGLRSEATPAPAEISIGTLVSQHHKSGIWQQLSHQFPEVGRRISDCTTASPGAGCVSPILWQNYGPHLSLLLPLLHPSHSFPLQPSGSNIRADSP